MNYIYHTGLWFWNFILLSNNYILNIYNSYHVSSDSIGIEDESVYTFAFVAKYVQNPTFQHSLGNVALFPVYIQFSGLVLVPFATFILVFHPFHSFAFYTNYKSFGFIHSSPPTPTHSHTTTQYAFNKRTTTILHIEHTDPTTNTIPTYHHCRCFATRRFAAETRRASLHFISHLILSHFNCLCCTVLSLH